MVEAEEFIEGAVFLRRFKVEDVFFGLVGSVVICNPTRIHVSVHVELTERKRLTYLHDLVDVVNVMVKGNLLNVHFD